MNGTTRITRMETPAAARRALANTAMLLAALAAAPDVARAQQQQSNTGHAAGNAPRLHVNSRWKECSFQLDPALTQKAFRQFAGEAGVVTYFRPLVGARPMGRGRYEVSLVQWETGIDDSDAAWNDTFVHPDSAHTLFDGSRLAFPGLTARIGLTDRTDAGVYFTKSPGANYGFYGAQLQHALRTSGAWSAAGRVSVVTLFGPADLAFAVSGVDLVASRRIGLFAGRAAVSPYAVASASLSRANEKSSLVDLRDEYVAGLHGTLGAVGEFSNAKVAVEYSVARVPSLSLKLGFGTN